MDHLPPGLLCFVFLATFLLGQVHLENAKRNIKSLLTREKCIDELGCFSAAPPFFDILERPLSLLPDDREQINTKFLLHIPENPDKSFNFSNMDLSSDYPDLSGFDPNLETKFVIPGFFSSLAQSWKQPLIEALLNFEECNVFYVDWSGGDEPLYEQAVANTRVVGAEVALFIQHLQQKAFIKPESVHLIGHSLGSHIAGYAGKRIRNLGRITAMDPAGPYFSNVDPVVRLDRSDALLVDAIHTNAAFSRLTGFGLKESIGHFDFFPNGGHLQPGCKDMGHSVLDFLLHPKFDEDGLHEIMCNHGRAIDIFISSLVQNDCQLMGAPCDSWDDFIEGKCGNCARANSSCVTVGIYADHHADLVDRRRSLQLYLNTTDTKPFCVK